MIQYLILCLGYGSPVPVTRLGRIMCIVFSLFGIPLTLVTIADIGKFLSEHLVWLYGNYLKLKSLLKKRHIKKERQERICEDCRSRGLSHNMQIVEEQRLINLVYHYFMLTDFFCVFNFLSCEKLSMSIGLRWILINYY